MPLEEIKNSPKVIGTKQVKKAIARGEVKQVLIAANADSHIVDTIMDLCKQKQVEFVLVQDMQTLGKACGIEVGSATAAVLND